MAFSQYKLPVQDTNLGGYQTTAVGRSPVVNNGSIRDLPNGGMTFGPEPIDLEQLRGLFDENRGGIQNDISSGFGGINSTLNNVNSQLSSLNRNVGNIATKGDVNDAVSQNFRNQSGQLNQMQNTMGDISNSQNKGFSNLTSGLGGLSGNVQNFQTAMQSTLNNNQSDLSDQISKIDLNLNPVMANMNRGLASAQNNINQQIGQNREAIGNINFDTSNLEQSIASNAANQNSLLRNFRGDVSDELIGLEALSREGNASLDDVSANVRGINSAANTGFSTLGNQIGNIRFDTTDLNQAIANTNDTIRNFRGDFRGDLAALDNSRDLSSLRSDVRGVGNQTATGFSTLGDQVGDINFDPQFSAIRSNIGDVRGELGEDIRATSNLTRSGLDGITSDQAAMRADLLSSIGGVGEDLVRMDSAIGAGNVATNNALSRVRDDVGRINFDPEFAALRGDINSINFDPQFADLSADLGDATGQLRQDIQTASGTTLAGLDDMSADQLAMREDLMRSVSGVGEDLTRMDSAIGAGNAATNSALSRVRDDVGRINFDPEFAALRGDINSINFDPQFASLSADLGDATGQLSQDIQTSTGTTLAGLDGMNADQLAMRNDLLRSIGGVGEDLTRMDSAIGAGNAATNSAIARVRNDVNDINFDPEFLSINDALARASDSIGQDITASSRANQTGLEGMSADQLAMREDLMRSLAGVGEDIARQDSYFDNTYGRIGQSIGRVEGNINQSLGQSAADIADRIAQAQSSTQDAINQGNNQVSDAITGSTDPILDAIANVQTGVDATQSDVGGVQTGVDAIQGGVNDIYGQLINPVTPANTQAALDALAERYGTLTGEGGFLYDTPTGTGLDAFDAVRALDNRSAANPFDLDTVLSTRNRAEEELRALDALAADLAQQYGPDALSNAPALAALRSQLTGLIDQANVATGQYNTRQTELGDLSNDLYAEAEEILRAMQVNDDIRNIYGEGGASDMQRRFSDLMARAGEHDHSGFGRVLGLQDAFDSSYNSLMDRRSAALGSIGSDAEALRTMIENTSGNDSAAIANLRDQLASMGADVSTFGTQGTQDAAATLDELGALLSGREAQSVADMRGLDNEIMGLVQGHMSTPITSLDQLQEAQNQLDMFALRANNAGSQTTQDEIAYLQSRLNGERARLEQDAANVAARQAAESQAAIEAQRRSDAFNNPFASLPNSQAFDVMTPEDFMRYLASRNAHQGTQFNSAPSGTTQGTFSAALSAMQAGG